jgi:dienelactone hydrolase
MTDQNMPVHGVAAGVPYVALPPAGSPDAPLIVAWHLNDPPRSAAAIGLVGASIGALPAQWVLTDRTTPVSAAALISPVIQLAEVVAANERRFGVTYPWSDAARAVAARLDFVARADDIAAHDPPPAILLVTGADDDPAFPLQTQRLHTELCRRYDDPGRVGLTTIPGMGHAFAAEPGIEPAPPTADATAVDAAVTDWFRHHLG